MNVSPYRADAADLIRGAHEQRSKMTITAGATVWEVPILAGSVTLSEDWSPFAQLSATVPNIFTTAELAQLDPRQLVTVRVTAGYVFPDGFADMNVIFTGQLEERKVRNPDGVIDIKASGAELFAIESKWLDVPTWKTFAGVNEAVQYFAAYGTPGGAVPFTSSLPNAYQPSMVTSIPLDTGDVLWDVLDDIATTAGVRLYVDVDGTWTIAPKATAAAETDAFLTTGGGGIVTESEDILTRDDYYGAAAIKFSWKDAGGVDRTMTGRYGAAGAKTFTADRKRAVTQLQADNAAKLTVKNLSTRGNSYQLSGVAAYWLRPGDTVQVTLANGTEARHIAKAVTFNLTGATMRVSTREPQNIT
jgi:hypothetical protein